MVFSWKKESHPRSAVVEDDPPGLGRPQGVVAVVHAGVDGEVGALVHAVAGSQDVVVKDEGAGARPGPGGTTSVTKSDGRIISFGHLVHST